MIKIAQLDGGNVVLEDETLREFKSAVRGEIITQEEVGYDDARIVFNGMIDKRPALIVRWIILRIAGW